MNKLTLSSLRMTLPAAGDFLDMFLYRFDPNTTATAIHAIAVMAPKRLAIITQESDLAVVSEVYKVINIQIIR